jgi:hypothetical protein
MLLPLMRAHAFLFEVMDKEPSLLAVWTVSLLLGVGGLLLSKQKYWLPLVALAVALFFAGGHISELNDRSVGPQIIREAGYSYVVQSYVALAIAVALPLIGAILNWRKGGKGRL